MALASNQFVSPAGDLRPDMLPGESLTAALTAWIEEADAKTADFDSAIQDEAGAAWVYHRAYRAVFLRLNSIPSDASVEEKGRVAWTRAQIDAFKALSDEYRAAFDGYAADEAAPPIPLKPSSAVVTTTPRWW